MRTMLWSFLIALTWTACQPGGGQADSPDLEGFTVETIPGTSYKRAYKEEKGRIAEEGMLLKGQKSGTWITYHTDTRHFPRVIATYAGGKLNGPYMEFNQFGQYEVLGHYQNNLLHGKVYKYKVTRLIEELNYKEGVLDGPYTLYFEKNDGIQRTAEFKDGKEHGFIRYFNEQGQVTMQYEYRNGEKVSGGMIEQTEGE